jgi:hypothetical protein
MTLLARRVRLLGGPVKPGHDKFAGNVLRLTGRVAADIWTHPPGG